VSTAAATWLRYRSAIDPPACQCTQYIVWLDCAFVLMSACLVRACGCCPASAHVPMCQLLLEYGADISQRDAVGATPLIHAAASGATAAVQLLLDSKAGANLGLQWLLQQATTGGETALMAAAKGGHLDTLQVCIALVGRSSNTCSTHQVVAAMRLKRRATSSEWHCMAGGSTRPALPAAFAAGAVLCWCRPSSNHCPRSDSATAGRQAQSSSSSAAPCQPVRLQLQPC
jgi:hypothetical protein